MSSMSLAVVISLALIVHYASAMINAGNPEILPECGHIPMEEGQINSFIGSHGTRCCMCGKGTSLAKECSIQDAKSTKCETCKYDSKKKQWHYVDYEPHVESECYEPEAESSCMTPKVLVGGSRFERARCECPTGTVAIGKFCESVSIVSTKQVSEPLGTVEDDVTDILTETSQPSIVSQRTSAEPTQKAIEPVEAVPLSDSETTEVPISVSTHLDSSTASSNESTENHTTAGVKAEQSNNTAFFSIIGALAIIIILVILYFVGEKYGLFGSGGICCTKHQRSENDVTYTTGKPSDETDKSCDKLLEKAGQEVKIEMSPIKEMPQSNNMAISFIARWPRLAERFGIRLPQTHPTDDRLGEPDAEPDRDPIDPEVGADRRDRVERPVNCRHPISERERELRYDAFSEMAEQIVPTDLCRIGRALLSTKRNAFEDIYGSCPSPADREEKARKIFIRAVQLNPQLSLQDILNLVRGLGYLRDIVKAKMDQMRTDGEVD